MILVSSCHWAHASQSHCLLPVEEPQSQHHVSCSPLACPSHQMWPECLDHGSPSGHGVSETMCEDPSDIQFCDKSGPNPAVPMYKKHARANTNSERACVGSVRCLSSAASPEKSGIVSHTVLQNRQAEREAVVGLGPLARECTTVMHNRIASLPSALAS